MEHANHTIIVWESTGWLVNMETGETDISVDEMDRLTPAYCGDCKEEVSKEVRRILLYSL